MAKEFTQKVGIDFTEVLSLVVRFTSIRIILSLIAVYDIYLKQMDVKTAFLHSEIQEKIFIAQPEGFVDSKRSDWVYFVKKSLYGLN